MIGDDLVAIDVGVDGGNFFEGIDRGLDEERHETETDLVLLLELFLVLRAQRHNAAHVGLVEGCENRRCLLYFHQPLCKPLTKPRHGCAGLTLVGEGYRLWSRTFGFSGCWSRRRNGYRLVRRKGFEVTDDIAFENPAALAGAFDLCGIQLVLEYQALYRW